jgi:hypothetical protein
VWLILYLPFGALGRFVTVALTFLTAARALHLRGRLERRAAAHGGMDQAPIVGSLTEALVRDLDELVGARGARHVDVPDEYRSYAIAAIRPHRSMVGMSVEASGAHDPDRSGGALSVVPSR